MAINKILVYDDYHPEVRNMERIIAATGCVDITAGNGREAYAMAKLRW